jgi:hypothetical protein
MPALGQKQNVQRTSPCPLWVISRHVQCTNPCPLYSQKQTCAVQLGMSAMGQKRTSAVYSITSSARPISVFGTLRPSALAVLRLITSSYLVGACTGRSPAFSPLRMRST